MRTTPKIETVEQPVIGKWYLVPCVCVDVDLEKHRNARLKDESDAYAMLPLTVKWLHPVYSKGYYVPVIGVHHEDYKELNFPHYHYHYDWRFMPKYLMTQILDINEKWKHETYDHVINSCDFGDKRNGFLGKVLLTEFLKDRSIVYRKMKMKYKQPMFRNAPEFKNRFEHNYIGKKLLCGKVCPHKGTTLTGARMDAKGRLICPTHGLAFNKETEICEQRFFNPDHERQYLKTIQTLGDGK